MSIQWPANPYKESSTHYLTFEYAIDACKKAHQDFINSQEQNMKAHFEQNLLDGNKVSDCGKAMLSAESVWEYIKENYSQAQVGGKVGLDEIKILKNEQLIVDPKRGDCFRACLTSLLGIQNTEEFPDGGDKEWFLKWSKFLNGMGLSIQYTEKAFWRSGYWIASVKSLNFLDVTHAIIMDCQEVYFDPSTKEKYLSGENLLSKDVVLGGWYLEVEDLSKLTKAICAKFKPVDVPSVEDIRDILEEKIWAKGTEDGTAVIGGLAESAQAIHALLIGRGK